MLLFLQCSANDSSEPDESFILHAVEELRIGDLEGDDEYIFGSINDIAVGTNGEIIVADGQVPIIRMFDKDGNFLRNVGRQGHGPGEYQIILGMKALPDGSFASWDPRNLRVNLYNPNGDFVESHSVQSSLFSSNIFQVDHSGDQTCLQTDIN